MDLFNPNKRKKVYDKIRQTWVSATPEELIRQQLLNKMVDHLHYPQELLVIEKKLSELPHLTEISVPDRRLDILCYAKKENGLDTESLFPLLLIECKVEKSLTEVALNQVIGYNHYVGAHFVAVANLQQEKLGFFDKEKKEYLFCTFLPPFKELMQWVKR